MSTIAMKDVLALSVAERIQLVEDIWDTIAASGESVAVSDALREELDRRVEDHWLHPDGGTDCNLAKHKKTTPVPVQSGSVTACHRLP